MNGPVTTGSLVSRTFSLFASGWLPFLAITFLVHSPLILLRLYAAATGEDPLAALPVGLDMIESLASLLLLAPIATAAVVYGVFRGLRGERSTIGECLRVGLGRWFPVVILSLLVGLATGLATLACIIPGIIVACGLIVAVPALVVEKLPVPEAFGRSWRLTDGHRLSIFGVFVVLFLIAAAIQVPLALIFLPDLTALGAAQLNPMFALVNLVVSIVLAAFQSIASAVIYYDLRVFKEGMDADELAAVFD